MNEIRQQLDARLGQPVYEASTGLGNVQACVYQHEGKFLIFIIGDTAAGAAKKPFDTLDEAKATIAAMQKLVIAPVGVAIKAEIDRRYPV